ncbi:MAG: 16S rRNA (guanine1516-N2)-methyltransferase [Flavobacteriales bacterium]|jgi:16S rRNA (guanine1516-N2)-methyltransferase
MDVFYSENSTEDECLEVCKALNVEAQCFNTFEKIEFVNRYNLVFDGHKRFLHVEDGKERFDIQVDFTSGGNDHRRKFGGGRGQAVAKAVGIKSGFIPSICDLTAGMGGDAFVLAGLGCEMSLYERHPIVHCLLAGGLMSANVFLSNSGDGGLFDTIQRMSIYNQSSLELNADVALYDVVFLDPMFPERKKKSAQVKKEMRVFHDLVGEDLDADGLLVIAKKLAKKRVVVKRPKIAPFLNGEKPSLSQQGKSTRFDIYLIQ